MRTCNQVQFKITVVSCILGLKRIHDIKHESDYIIKKICNTLLVEEKAVKGKSQIKDIVDARMLSVYFIHNKMEGMKHEAIAKLLNRSRSNIYNSLYKVDAYCKNNKYFKKKFDLINSILN